MTLIVVACALGAAALLAMLLWSHRPEFSEDWIRNAARGRGMLGPLMLIGLMVLAIVISPIPSGPIAVAAGAVYGTLLGGFYVVIGAVLGAMMAFGAVRWLGFDAVRRSGNPLLKYIAAPRSQTRLMLIVFGSRLIPFISFDAVSYAAGLTCLSAWRFALATVLGAVPISFSLAAAGAGLVGDTRNLFWIVALGGGLTVLPVVLHWFRSRA